MRGRRNAAGVAVAVVVGLSCGDAGAAGTCSYAADTGLVRIDVASERKTLVRGGDGVSADDPLLLDGRPCGAATVANAETITYGGEGGTFVVSLRGGPLGPGRTDEVGDSDELEIEPTTGGNRIDVVVEGSERADKITKGSDGINLNAGEAPDGDVDVFGADTALREIDGAGGDDLLSTDGQAGTGERAGATVVRGGPGDDQITGHGVSVRFYGDAGADRLEAAAPAELHGGPDHDVAWLVADAPVVVDMSRESVRAKDGSWSGSLTGCEDAVAWTSGDDLVIGDGGDNRLRGDGQGGDRLRGGPGNDTLGGGIADYSTAPSAISTTWRRVEDGEGGVDTLEANEMLVRGSRFDDRFDGTNRVEAGPGDDTLIGREGDDQYEGGPGDDYIDGGVSTDTLVYSNAPAGVAVDLPGGTAADGEGGIDTVAGFENILGSLHDDRLVGTNWWNYIYGGPGDDVVFAGSRDDIVDLGPGNDVLDGGGGADELDVGGKTVLPVVDLEAGTATDGWGGTDHFSSFEEVWAFSDQPARIAGDDGPNKLVGGMRDVVRGRGGDDRLQAGRMLGGPGYDTMYAEAPEGSHAVFDYSEAASGVTISVPDWDYTIVSDGDGGEDMLRRPGAVLGSAFDDVITGSRNDDWIDGGRGDDRVAGLDGDDELAGGPGIDTVDGGNGTDRIRVRDSLDDAGTCGPGEDSIVADTLPFDGLTECETAERPTPTVTPEPGADSAPPSSGTSSPEPTAVPPSAPSTTPAPGPAAPKPLALRAIPRRPSLRRLARHGLAVRVQCSAPCALRARLVASARTRRDARLAHRTVVRAATRLGTRAESMRLRPTRRTARRLQRLRTANLTLVVEALAANGTRATAGTSLRLRR